MQLAEPAPEKVPAAQDVHWVSPSLLRVPAGQSRQVVAPGAEDRPAGQFKHEAAPALEKIGGGRSSARPAREKCAERASPRLAVRVHEE